VPRLGRRGCWKSRHEITRSIRETQRLLDERRLGRTPSWTNAARCTTHHREGASTNEARPGRQRSRFERRLVAFGHGITSTHLGWGTIVGIPDWLRARVGRESIRPGLDDLAALLRRYLVQETIGPLKAIAKGVLIALGGAALFALGGVIVLVGVLRVLESETGSAFAGNWSFVPYVVTAAAGLLLIGLAALVTFRSLRLPRSRRV